MIKIFKKYLKPYAGNVGLVIFLTIITTLGSLVLPMLSKNIIDEGAVASNSETITRTMIIMLIVAAVTVGLSVLTNYLSTKVAMGFSKDLRDGFFLHVANLSQGDINKIGSSSLISRQTNDIQQLQLLTTQLLQVVLTAPVMAIGGILMALLTAPSMSWMIVVMLPIVITVLVVILNKVRPSFSESLKKLDTVNRIIRENLYGMRVVRAFNREEYEEKHFDEANQAYRGLAENVNKLMLSLAPILTGIVNGMNLLILYFGSRYMDDQIVSFGDVQAFIQYVSMILLACMLCSMLMLFIPRGQIAAERINQVLDTVPSIRDPEKPVSIPDNAESSIQFKDVTFYYEGAEEPVLSSISFSAKKGEKLAIIGGTGSGKSTILNLITRDYDVSSGEILVDGVDIRQLRLHDLHDRLAVVPQKAFLFAGSIFDNIRYGKEDATVEEVEHALYISQSKEFVDQKDYGMYTYITPSGTNVSGGQKQRLAIARALIRHPDLYLFDDSFSALDFKTDAKIRKLLKAETKDAVMIVVAQRVSTIKDADRIIVLDAGKIAGIGTHDELMETCDIYREIALSQTAEKEDN